MGTVPNREAIHGIQIQMVNDSPIRARVFFNPREEIFDRELPRWWSTWFTFCASDDGLFSNCQEWKLPIEVLATVNAITVRVRLESILDDMSTGPPLPARLEGVEYFARRVYAISRDGLSEDRLRWHDKKRNRKK